MRISFDLDETLICYASDAPQESGFLPISLQRHATEKMRLGTRKLIRELQQRGHEVWIYTSSLRSPFHVWLWLLLHGIRANSIINDDRHRRQLIRQNFTPSPSKYPPAFGIDLHIDDSEGVRIEGTQHNFQVLVISPKDNNWTAKVLDAADNFHQANHPK
jgi:hypothetical protein